MFPWRLHSYGKEKILDVSFQMPKNDQNYACNWEKKFNHVKIMILWICEGTTQFEVVGFPSYQKIVINFKWLITLMPSSG